MWLSSVYGPHAPVCTPDYIWPWSWWDAGWCAWGSPPRPGSGHQWAPGQSVALRVGVSDIIDVSIYRDTSIVSKIVSYGNLYRCVKQYIIFKKIKKLVFICTRPRSSNCIQSPIKRIAKLHLNPVTVKPTRQWRNKLQPGPEAERTSGPCIGYIYKCTPVPDGQATFGKALAIAYCCVITLRPSLPWCFLRGLQALTIFFSHRWQPAALEDASRR